MTDETMSPGRGEDVQESAEYAADPQIAEGLEAPLPSAPVPSPEEVASLELSAAEQRLVDVKGREYCLFDTDLPKEDRTIRAETLRVLMMGSRREWLPKLSRIAVRGAHIAGDLDLIYVRRRDDRDAPLFQVLFDDCDFDGGLYLQDAAIEGLELIGCRMPAIHARGLKASGVVKVDACDVAGEVDFESSELLNEVSLDGTTVGSSISFLSATIGRNLTLNGVTVGSKRLRSKSALSLNGTKIGGALFMRRSVDPAGRSRVFQALGEVNAVGADIPGGVYMTRARFANPGATALNFRQATLGPVSMRGEGDERLSIEGVASFAFAQIATEMVISRCVVLGGRDERRPEVDRVCLNLERVKVTGVLSLDNLSGADGGRPQGAYLLTGGHVGELKDNPKTAWPVPGRLDLQGFTYTSLDFELSESGDRSKQRLAWLDLQRPPRAPWAWLRFWRPIRDIYLPQPYEQLVKALRLMGYGEDADDVAIAKRRHRNRCRADRITSRLASRFVGLTSRYGYSPGRAAVSACVVVALGWLGLSEMVASGAAILVPLETVNASEAPATRYLSGLPDHWIAWLASHLPAVHPETWNQRTLVDVAHGCPAFVAPLYALDLAVPVLDLGQESACRLETRGLAGAWLQGGRIGYQILGAIMTAILITTLTGVLRRD